MGGEVERAALIVNRRDREIRQTYHEESDGTIRIRTSQDAAPAIEAAKAARRADRENRGRFGKRGDFRRTLSTPINIYYAVCQKLGIPLRRIFDDDVSERITKEIKKEFPAFRTTEDKRI